jgi:hypothetical protein
LGVENSIIPSTSSPYALRAVNLLEKIEELEHATPSASDLAEKAWVLYRLGLYDQGVELASEATQLDPACSDGWMLLAIDSHTRKKKALLEYSRSEVQLEIAEPLSGHEQWAEDMQAEAACGYFEARKKERRVLFNALKYWPKDSESKKLEYKYSEPRDNIRDKCISMIFDSLQPCDFSDISAFRNLGGRYKVNGLEPEYLLENKNGNDNHSNSQVFRLSETERSVAQLICTEANSEGAKYISWQHENRVVVELMLLHIRYVLEEPSYDEVRIRFLKQFCLMDADDLNKILRVEGLLNAYVTHLSAEGIETIKDRLEATTAYIEEKCVENRSFRELNLLRKVYDHAFARGEFADSLKVAHSASILANQLGDRSPRDITIPASSNRRANLSVKFFKYLEILAACKMDVDEKTALNIAESLTSINALLTYFSEESDYMVSYEECDDDFSDQWYQAAYEDSVISSGAWKGKLSLLADSNILGTDLISTVKSVIESFGQDISEYSS